MFLREIWPTIRRQRPDVVFDVAGSRLPSEIVAYCSLMSRPTSAVLRLLDDPALATCLQQNSRQLAERTYDYRRACQPLGTLYQQARAYPPPTQSYCPSYLPPSNTNEIA